MPKAAALDWLHQYIASHDKRCNSLSNYCMVGACRANVKFSGRQMEQSQTSGWDRESFAGNSRKAEDCHESTYDSSSKGALTMHSAILDDHKRV